MTGRPDEAPPPGPRSAQRRASRLMEIAEAVGVHTSTMSGAHDDPAQSMPLAELGSAAVDALITRIDQGAGLDQEPAVM